MENIKQQLIEYLNKENNVLPGGYDQVETCEEDIFLVVTCGKEKFTFGFVPVWEDDKGFNTVYDFSLIA